MARDLMTVRITKVGEGRDLRKAVLVRASQVAVDAPGIEDYLIEAQVDEGDSPIRIHLSNGAGSGVTLPVKRLLLTRSSKYRVRKHPRKGSRATEVREHDKSKPASTRHYAKKAGISDEQKKKLSHALKAAWKKRYTEGHGTHNYRQKQEQKDRQKQEQNA